MRTIGRFCIAAIALIASIYAANAQNAFPTPQGSNTGSSAPMCRSAANSALFVPCDATNPLPVAATASISGFAPGGAFATLTATGSSASVALPAGAVVVFNNIGTTAVSCTLGVGSATAIASENIIQPGSWFAFTVGSNTFGACIDQTGSASNVVVLSGGTGLPTGSGGGSSGGGGGASTIADGADVAEGTTTDGACAGDATSGCTVLSRLSRIAARLTTLIAQLPAAAATAANQATEIASLATIATNTGAAIPAGTALIGKVGIDQTTPGTTNGIALASVAATATVAPVSTLNSASGGGAMPSAIAGVFDDASPTAITENNFGFVRMSANRNVYHTMRDAAGNERGQNVDANNNAGVVLPAETTKVIGTVRVQGNVGGVLDAVIGAAAPANSMALASLGGGATGGLLARTITCDSHVFKHITSATDTLAVQGVASQTIYVCGWRSRAAGTATWFLENTASTNANCSSSNTQITGVASEVANSGDVVYNPVWGGLKNTSGNGLCINSTGTGGVDVDIWYAQF